MMIRIVHIHKKVRYIIKVNIYDFHLDKLCKVFNDLHPENKLSIFLIFKRSQIDISGKEIKEQHS